MRGEEQVFQRGERCAKYTIERLIGRGGMGEVYLARDPWMDRDVAMKVLPLRRLSQPDFRDRMQREAQAGARVNHPNLVRVIDGGITEHDVVYLVMEYLDGGRTLRDLIHHSAPFPEELVAAYGMQIAQGMDALHKADILHRDLKPENIVVVPPGIVKIIDFGLARIRTHALRTTVRPGEKGLVLGTAHYMAPEQIFDAHAVTDRADVYAVGLIVHEMATGRHVFQASTDDFPTRDEVSARHQWARARSLSELLPGISQDLSDIVDRALSKNPAARPSARELAAALGDVHDRLVLRAGRVARGSSPVPGAADGRRASQPPSGGPPQAPPSPFEVATTAPTPPNPSSRPLSHVLRTEPLAPEDGPRPVFDPLTGRPRAPSQRPAFVEPGPAQASGALPAAHQGRAGRAEPAPTASPEIGAWRPARAAPGSAQLERTPVLDGPLASSAIAPHPAPTPWVAATEPLPEGGIRPRAVPLESGTPIPHASGARSSPRVAALGLAAGFVLVLLVGALALVLGTERPPATADRPPAAVSVASAPEPARLPAPEAPASADPAPASVPSAPATAEPSPPPVATAPVRLPPRPRPTPAPAVPAAKATASATPAARPSSTFGDIF